MSRDTVVAKRYAKALFELAQQQNIISEAEDQLKLIVATIEQDADIAKFLNLPNVSVEDKITVLKAAFGDRVSAVVQHTLELLITRGRQDAIAAVLDAYTKVAGEALRQALTTVYSARALTDAELEEVAAQFSGIVGKKIIAKQIVEPALLGGVQVRIGDRLYDGSLSGKLDRLQKSLNSKAL